MINGTIKVTTQELLAKADSVNERIDGVKRHFSAMNETVGNSGRYWQGDAGDIHRKTFSDKKPAFEEILKRFSEHVKDLTDMARIYDVTESAIQEKLVNELPEDVIV